MDFYDAYDSLNENDEYDEFLFESIRRYNTLQMFELEHLPYRLFQIDNTSICITSKHNKNNSEILKLQLPVKLTLPPEEEGRSKENDFKVLSLLYSDNLVYNIDKLVKSEKIITSEYNDNGLKIYSFCDSLLGSKSMSSKLDSVSWSAFDFVVIEERNSLICSKHISEPLIQVDASSGEKIKEIKNPFHNQNTMKKEVEQNDIKCQVLGTDLIAVLNTYSADLVLHDLRTNNCFTSLPGIKEKNDKEIWTLSDSDSRDLSLHYFGILSNKKSFCIYDKRTESIIIQSENSDCSVSNPNNLRLKFYEKSNKFSISGMNSTVEVFKIMENNFHHVFTHNGHCPTNSPSTFVTDHIWLNSGGKEFVVSICDNKTLNCWDYKA